jgi:Uma2 family endonuclease
VVPDWVCDILSPARASLDRDVKLPIHARHGASFAWLVDPKERTLEAYTLEDRKWREMGRLANDDLVVVAPFDAVTIQLVDLRAPA